MVLNRVRVIISLTEIEGIRAINLSRFSSDSYSKSSKSSWLH